ncbi:MAG: hypothetical protein ACK5Q0_09230, partial [Lysobacteraceae bacterium]
NAALQGLYFPDIVGPIGELLPFRPICVDGERLYAPEPRSFSSACRADRSFRSSTGSMKIGIG